MPKVFKVAISVPNEAFISPEAYENHIMLAAHQGKLEKEWEYKKRNPRYEFYRFTTGRLLTPMAREKLIKEAIKGGMNYIVMMDNDMLYPIDFLEKMLEDIEKHPEIDILAPLAFMRSAPHYAVMYTLLDGYDSTTHTEYYINQFVKKYPKNKLVECDAVGFGAVLIKMDIFKKMKEPYCFSTTGTGEDIYLCYKARKEAKARVFMDTRIKLGHMGHTVIIDEEYREKYAKEHGEEILDVPHKYVSYTR
jgi:hypothetical protein